MPVKRPKKRRTSPVSGKVTTRKNTGVARKAGRGKLGGGVVKVTPTKRSGKSSTKSPYGPPMQMGGGINPGTYTPSGFGLAAPSVPKPAPKKKKKKPNKNKGA